MGLRIAVRLGDLKALILTLSTTAIERALLCLGRKVGGEEYVVEELVECRNVAEEPTREFLIDPPCMWRALKRAEERGLELVAIAHGHPAPPWPSPKDLNGMELWDVPWIIVDSRAGTLRAWVLTEKGLEEVEVVEL